MEDFAHKIRDDQVQPEDDDGDDGQSYGSQGSHEDDLGPSWRKLHVEKGGDAPDDRLADQVEQKPCEDNGKAPCHYAAFSL